MVSSISRFSTCWRSKKVLTIYIVKLCRSRHQEFSFRQRTQFEVEKEMKIRTALLFFLLFDCCLRIFLIFHFKSNSLHVPMSIFFGFTLLSGLPETLSQHLVTSHYLIRTNVRLVQPRLCFPDSKLERCQCPCQQITLFLKRQWKKPLNFASKNVRWTKRDSILKKKKKVVKRKEEEKWKAHHILKITFGSSVAIFLVWYTILEVNNHYTFSVSFHHLCCVNIKKNKASYVLANYLRSTW